MAMHYKQLIFSEEHVVGLRGIRDYGSISIYIMHAGIRDKCVVPAAC